MIRAHLVCIAFSLILLGAACSTMSGEPTPASVPEPMPIPTAAPQRPYVHAGFESAECQFSSPSDSEVECGYLIVPEDRSNPERMIRFACCGFLSSQGSDAEPDPVVYLEGGPGGSALANFEC